MRRQLAKLTRTKVKEEQAGLIKQIGNLQVRYHSTQLLLQSYREALGSLRPYWPAVTLFLLWQGRSAYNKALKEQQRERLKEALEKEQA